MKKKKILILTTVLSIVLMIVIFGTLYFTTDFLKTNKQLFYKYITKVEIMDFELFNQIKLANERVVKNSNSSSMSLDISMPNSNQINGATDAEKLLIVNSNGLENVSSKQSYKDFDISILGKKFLTLRYIRDDNTYAITIDDIMIKYLAVENTNLKEFFGKLGVQDVSQIPDTISPIMYEKIFEIDEITFKQLKQTYGMLLNNCIGKENFYKIKNQDKTETIGLSLTEQEVNNLIKIFLETAKNDTTLLNLLITKAQMLNYKEITIEIIQAKIQELLDESANLQCSTEKDFIKISLIKNGEKVIKIQLDNKYSDTNIYSLNLDFSNSNNINLAIKENDILLGSTNYSYSYNENDINFNFETFDEKNENIGQIQFQISGYKTNNISQTYKMNIKDMYRGSYMNSVSSQGYIIELKQQTELKQDVQIQKLTPENSVKLNDMTSEKLNQIFVELGNRVSKLYEDILYDGFYKDMFENQTQNIQNTQEKYEEARRKEEEQLQEFINRMEQYDVPTNN